MINSNQIIAFGLLAQEDHARLGPQFARAFPIDETPCFAELLDAIDRADRASWRDCHAATDQGRTEPRHSQLPARN